MQTLSSWSHVHIISRHIICTMISYHNTYYIHTNICVLCLHYTSSEIAPAQVPGTNLLPSHARAKAMGGGQLSGHLCYMIYIHLIQRCQSFGTSTSEFSFDSWIHPLDFSILQNFKLSQLDHQAKEVPPLPFPVSITHLAGTAKAYVLSARRNSALLADASKANSKALERRKTWRRFGAEGGKHA